jgi:hypothetical protein
MVMILAHQGGWDEFLDFAVPVSAGMLVLRLLYRFERKPFETLSRERRFQNREEEPLSLRVFCGGEGRT